MKNRHTAEKVIHGAFLFLGLITVGFVLLITVYLIISGIPAIREIGLIDFLFGTKWDSTADDPSFGILPFILTSIYGTAGAILLGVPIGFLTAVYLSKIAPKGIRQAMEYAVSLMAGIPSVIYGLVGMLVLVPAIRKIFDLPDGSGLLASIIVLAVMILPSVLCDPPGSSVHGISQARILESVAISFSRGSSQPRDGNCVSCIAGRFFYRLNHQFIYYS